MLSDRHTADLEDNVSDPVRWAFLTGALLLRARKASLLLRDAGEPVLVAAAVIGIDPSIVSSIRIPIGKGLAGLVAERGIPLLGARGEERFICAPIIVGDRVEGVLYITGDPQEARYEDEDLATAALVARHIGHLLTWRRAPSTQPVVELPSTRDFEEMLERELARSKRLGMPLSLALIDLGDAPDTQSPEESGLIACIVTEALRRSVRRYDVVDHHAGGEFAVLLAAPSAPDEGVANRIAGIVHDALRGMDIDTPIRVGLAHCPRDGISSNELMTAAATRLQQSGKVRSIS